jgi:4-carboxymuconolactone decarboxylase
MMTGGESTMAKAAAKTAKKPAAKAVSKKAAAPKAAAPKAAKAAAPAAKRAPKRRAEFSSKLFQQGLDVRRAVLGGEYVDNSIANASEFMVDFQKLVTEYCWGDVWTRPGLDRKHRSMLNLAMLTALNRPNELKLHLRGAITNGVSRDEIKEILLQACIYAGIPAGLDAFKVADGVFKEMDAK